MCDNPKVDRQETGDKNRYVDWSRNGLQEAGFTGFVPIAELDRHQVPQTPGVYLVVRPGADSPRFLPRSPAGWLKGRDPSVPISVLERNWVTGSSVLYIGKAGGGSTGRRGIQKRLNEYRRHGRGEPAGHWGGRFVWQLEASGSLLVCWKPTDEKDPEEVESALLAQFVADFAALPFANRKGGRTPLANSGSPDP